MSFGLRRAKGLGYLSVQLVSKISNVCDPDPPTLQTDRRTDGQTDDIRSVKTNALDSMSYNVELVNELNVVYMRGRKRVANCILGHVGGYRRTNVEYKEYRASVTTNCRTHWAPDFRDNIDINNVHVI